MKITQDVCALAAAANDKEQDMKQMSAKFREMSGDAYLGCGEEGGQLGAVKKGPLRSLRPGLDPGIYREKQGTPLLRKVHPYFDLVFCMYEPPSAHFALNRCSNSPSSGL